MTLYITRVIPVELKMNVLFIRELRDTKFIPEKITSKDAKEMFENAQRLEKEYKYIFNGKLACV
jgi:hypothetical protein